MSWKQPVLTAEFAAVGVTALLEAIRRVDPEIRFYQASSSEIFGEPDEVPQQEETRLLPVTPYGVAKAYGHLIVRSYRKRYGLYACSGILFNHESPRRPLDFLRGRSRTRLRRSRSASRASSGSATWTLGATGGTPPTTYGRWRSCSGRPSRTTT